MFACFLAFLLGLVQPSEAQEFRRITLSDGRSLAARVDATTADGLTLTLPQGTVRVPFSLVMNIENIDEATWKDQPSWDILVLPLSGPSGLAQPASNATREALSRLPSSRVFEVSQLVSRLDPGAYAGLVACQGNLECATPYAASAGMTAMLSGTVLEGTPSRVLLKGTFIATPAVRGEGDASLSGPPHEHPRELLTAAALALLVMPSEATLATLPARLSVPPPVAGATVTPPSVTTAPVEPAPTKPIEPAAPRTPPSAARLRGLAWVPVPGAPSLARRDWTGFAASWALAIPSSAALVYGAGDSAMTKGEFIGLSVVSCYGATVASNLIFGLREGGFGAPITASALPTRGGATVALTVRTP